MKVLFVYNPLSGMTQIKGHLYSIINIFSKAEFDLNVHATTGHLDAFNVVKDKAREYDMIVCSGGDGTLNEVVNGIMISKADVRLGYIPAGSTNDYATSLGLSKNMLKAADLIVSGEPTNYDVGTFNDKFFIYVGAFGAFTNVAYNTPQETKNIVGHLAYVLEGIKSIASIKAFHLKIITDDLQFDEPFIYGMVTNTLSVGGIYRLKKDRVALNDGLFEVMLIRPPKSAIELSSITSFLLGIDETSPLISIIKTSKIFFETNEPLPWTIDGEFGGNLDKVKITNLKQAIKIIDHKKAV